MLASYAVNAALYWSATDGFSLPADTQEEIAPQGVVFGAEDRRLAQNSLEVFGALLGGCTHQRREA